jgi:hypothetical protein
MHNSFTTRQLDRRANSLLRQVRNVPSGSEIIRELAEITLKIEDAPVKPEVVARLTAFRKDGRRTIVEVYSSSTFHSFFYVYSQQGNRRSTKSLSRVGNRNEAIPNGLITSGFGLAAISVRLLIWGRGDGEVIETKLRIFKKREYRRLLSVSPDQIWRRS